MKNIIIILAMLCGAAQAEVITVGCLTGDTFIHEDGSERVKWEKITDCDPALDAFKEGAIADIVSTVAALGVTDHLVEGNPAGVLGAAAIKVALYFAFKNTDRSPRRDLSAYRAGALQWGFAASNMCIIFVPVQALCAIVGTVTYFNKMEGVKHEHRFEVKTGEASGHAYTQSRFTPSGIEWVAGRWNARNNAN